MSKLKAVFFDLDDTLYTSFQAGDRYAYECMEKWAQETFGEAGHGFDAAFLTARKQLRRSTTACCLRSVRWKTWV